MVYAGFGRRAIAITIDIVLMVTAGIALVQPGYAQPIATAAVWILVSYAAVLMSGLVERLALVVFQIQQSK